jgi:protein-tyrosine phosphatase
MPPPAERRAANWDGQWGTAAHVGAASDQSEAYGNAHGNLLAAAREVTLSNEEDGAASVVERLLSGTIFQYTGDVADSAKPGSLMNFRDLGGAPVPGAVLAHGRLYRTGQLSEVSDEVACHLADTLQIGAYVDFRADPEIARDGEPRQLLQRGVAWSRQPFDLSDTVFDAIRLPGAGDWQQLYFRGMTRLQPEISAAIRAIAAWSRPVVFGCWVGKDRTGIVAALLLSLLGVDDEWIGLDYAKTQASIQPFRSRFSFLWQAEPHAESQLWRAHSGTEPQTVIGFLRLVRGHFGSVERALALPDEVVARLRERYLV